MFGFDIFYLIFVIGLAYVMYRYRKILKKTESLANVKKILYYREFPDENATPADAAFLHFFKDKVYLAEYMPHVISATILDLHRKNFLELITKEENGEEIVEINLINKEKLNELQEDEIEIYKLLQEISIKYNKKDNLTIKDIEKYSRNSNSKFATYLGRVYIIEKKKQQKKGNYNFENEVKKKEWEDKKIIFIKILVPVLCVIFVTVITEIFAAEKGSSLLLVALCLPLLIESIICICLCNKMVNKCSLLTLKGKEEKEKWDAFKRYIEENSLIEEKETEEVILWDKYLVYGTALGIADTVLKEIKIKYPIISFEMELDCSKATISEELMKGGAYLR